MQPQKSTKDQLRLLISSRAISFKTKNHLSDLKDIEYLELKTLTIEDAHFIKEHLKYLIKIKINQNCLDSDIIDVLSKIETLEDLEASRGKHFSVGELEKLNNLKRISIYNIYCSQDDLAKGVLTNNPQLQSLGVFTQLTQQNYLFLVNLKNLKQIHFHNCNISMQNLGYMMDQFNYLTSISLPKCYLYNDHIRIIAENISRLENLNIEWNLFCDDGLESLIKHKDTLKSLNVGNNFTSTYQGIKFIVTSLIALRDLKIYSRIATNDKQLPLSAKNLTHLQQLSMLPMSRAQDVDLFIHLFKQVPSLRGLEIRCFDTKLVKAILENTNKLESLKLSDQQMAEAGDAQCFYLSKMRSLKQVALSDVKVGEVGILKMLRNTSSSNSYFGTCQFLSNKSVKNMRILKLGRHAILRL